MSIKTELQPHQRRIVDRLTGDSPRLLLYHGLGTGKTLSAIAAAEAAGGRWGAAMPASLRDNFIKEVKLHSTGKVPPIRSYTELGLGRGFDHPLDTLVLDEAARIRNPEAASSRKAMEEASKASRLLLLSGTPIVNSPGDLAPIVSMLSGVDMSPKAFEDKFVNSYKVQPSLWNRLTGVKPGEAYDIQNEGELRKLLRGRVDYQPPTTPKGVKVVEQVIQTPLSEEQIHLQDTIKGRIPAALRWKLNSEFPLSRQEASNLNSFLTGLRQVSLSTLPFSKTPDGYTAYKQSPKLQAAVGKLKDLLNQDKRKKAVVFSNFITAGLHPYAAALEHEKIPFGYYYGGISPKVRQANLDAYNRGQLKVLLLGPAGSEGISTKGTSLLQLLDPHWNEARSSQAKGRGLRFDSHEGLPDELKNVQVQKFLSISEEPSAVSKLLGRSREKTGDEIISNLAKQKQELSDKFLEVLRREGQSNRT